jgi:lysozyme
MPQRVDEERPMTASTINRASVVAGGTAALASATEVVNTVSGFKSSLESLGQWIVPVLLAVTVAAAAYAVYQRVKQREEGWA